MSGRRYSHPELADFVAAVLRWVGVGADDAATAASVLVDADLAGVDTHGVANLARHDHYVPGLRRGSVAPRPEIEVVHESDTSARWDAHGGFGPVVAVRAMESAISKAAATGVGMVAVSDARHFGAHGHIAELATVHGMLGVALADTPGAAFPPGGRVRAVGTNPLAFAAPLPGASALVVDVAMTAVSGTRVADARRRGDAVPVGWVVDAVGHDTTDPAANRQGGALELLGGAVARHKGFALALMVQTLAMLSGNGPGPAQDPSRAPGGATWSQGQWFAAVRIDAFLDPADFLAGMGELAALVRASTGAGDTVRLPGERRAATRAERTAHGIPLADEAVADLHALAAEAGLLFPEPVAEPTPTPTPPSSARPREGGSA